MALQVNLHVVGYDWIALRMMQAKNLNFIRDNFQQESWTENET